jgi:uncharacterized membrane protein
MSLPPPEVLANLPEPLQQLLTQPGVSQSQLVSIFSAWMTAGPLPPPEMFQGYERVLPGSAERLFKMAESQLAHRQHLEKVAVEGADKRSWWGMWLGFVISLVVFGLGTALVVTGHDAAGAAIMTVDVAALASVFVVGQRAQQKEREAKDAQTHLPQPRIPGQ